MSIYSDGTEKLNYYQNILMRSHFLGSVIMFTGNLKRLIIALVWL